MGNCYEPFENAEEVWFWFCSSIVAKNDGWRVRGDYKGKEHCCEISDIYRIIKKMKLQSLITNRHLRVMVEWGKQSISPYYNKYAKRSELRLWAEGISALDFQLRSKGII